MKEFNLSKEIIHDGEIFDYDKGSIPDIKVKEFIRLLKDFNTRRFLESGGLSELELEEYIDKLAGDKLI